MLCNVGSSKITLMSVSDGLLREIFVKSWFVRDLWRKRWTQTCFFPVGFGNFTSMFLICSTFPSFLPRLGIWTNISPPGNCINNREESTGAQFSCIVSTKNFRVFFKIAAFCHLNWQNIFNFQNCWFLKLAALQNKTVLAAPSQKHQEEHPNRDFKWFKYL